MFFSNLIGFLLDIYLSGHRPIGDRDFVKLFQSIFVFGKNIYNFIAIRENNPAANPLVFGQFDEKVYIIFLV